MPKFKARPLPDFHEVNLPEKKVTEPTKPAPFKLMVDERGSVKSERWEQMVIFFFSSSSVVSKQNCRWCKKRIRLADVLNPVHEGNAWIPSAFSADGEMFSLMPVLDEGGVEAAS